MIPVNDLHRSYKMFEEEFDKKTLSVLKSGWYILGKEVKAFEEEFAAKFSDNVFSVGVDNGLNAIRLGLYAFGIGEGDEVIVQANGYIATVLGIIQNGATPVFVDSDEFHNINPELIESNITENTKAILVTHLYGMPTRMEAICDICKRKGLLLFEDCAQAHFAKYRGRYVGTFGDASFYSFYPTKNLGCFGDGGAVVSHNEDIIEKIKVLRNYGSDKRYHNIEVGFNSRLDEIQAGLLRIKLNHWDDYLKNRRYIANKYNNGINNKYVSVPLVPDGAESIWHLYVVNVEDRELFRRHMKLNGIATDVSYPMPSYMQPALSYLGLNKGSNSIAEKDCETVVSLPMMDYMDDEEIERVIFAVNSFEPW